MKSFLCLLLVAFIACESVDKNNEIVLKASDFINSYFDKLVSILDECNCDYSCYAEKFNEYYMTLSTEEYLEFSNFVMSSECHDVCMDKLSKFDEQAKTVFCSMCMTM